jgi:hypothetical protein
VARQRLGVVGGQAANKGQALHPNARGHGQGGSGSSSGGRRGPPGCALTSTPAAAAAAAAWGLRRARWVSALGGAAATRALSPLLCPLLLLLLPTPTPSQGPHRPPLLLYRRLVFPARHGLPRPGLQEAVGLQRQNARHTRVHEAGHALCVHRRACRRRRKRESGAGGG